MGRRFAFAQEMLAEKVAVVVVAVVGGAVIATDAVGELFVHHWCGRASAICFGDDSGWQQQQ